MKITKKKLRQLIREAIIDEAGYPGWRGGGSATRDYGHRPSRFKYKVGDIVKYRTLSGGERTVKVDARVTPYEAQEDLANGIEYDPDGIKNGKPGFDGTVILGKEKGRQTWGYDADILSVESDRGEGLAGETHEKTAADYKKHPEWFN